MLIDETKTTIAGHDKDLAQLQAELAALEATLPKDEPAVPKFDPEKHPLLKKAIEKEEPVKAVVFNAGDLCEAQWTDKQWYKVKVQTVLGSVSDPKYHVRFIDYADSTLTVDREKIRALPNDRKRKADGALQSPAVVPANNSPHVISGLASINPNATAKKQENDGDGNGRGKKRTIGGSKMLERKQSNWLDFQKKGVGKKLIKKPSQFRTGEGPNARGTHCPPWCETITLTVCSWLHWLRLRHDSGSQARAI